MKVIAMIQARDGSKRFPMKIWQDLGGMPVITRVATAAWGIKGIDEVRVIYAQHFPHRDENDVLGRYADAAYLYKADVIMRLTGDCPLFDPQVGSLLMEIWRAADGQYDYVSNVYPVRTWPDGLDCEIFTRAILDDANADATDPYQREHVTPWIQAAVAASGRYTAVTLPVDWSHVRLTIDTPEDLAWLKIALKAPRS